MRSPILKTLKKKKKKKENKLKKKLNGKTFKKILTSHS